MKTCIIFGGSRFLGPHLTVALQKAGYQVTHFRRGISTPPVPLTGVLWIKGDRNSAQDISLAFEKSYDLVIDLSGYELAHVTPIFSFRHRFRRYLFCSTSSVIAKNARMPYDENAPVTDTAEGYGAQKLAVERFLIDEFQKHGTPITIFRPQGIFGKYDLAQPGAIFKELSRKRRWALSPKKWDSKLNLLFVNDFTSALIKSIEAETTYGKIYNLANNDPVSLQDLVNLCAQIAKKNPQIDFTENAEPKWWHDYDLVAENHRIRTELEISFTPLDESLREVYREVQREWLRRPLALIRKLGSRVK